MGLHGSIAKGGLGRGQCWAIKATKGETTIIVCDANSTSCVEATVSANSTSCVEATVSANSTSCVEATVSVTRNLPVIQLFTASMPQSMISKERMATSTSHTAEGKSIEASVLNIFPFPKISEVQSEPV